MPDSEQVAAVRVQTTRRYHRRSVGADHQLEDRLCGTDSREPGSRPANGPKVQRHHRRWQPTQSLDRRAATRLVTERSNEEQAGKRHGSRQ